MFPAMFPRDNAPDTWLGALVIGMAPALLPSGDARAQGMNMKDMPGMKKDMPARKGEATKAATATGTVTAVNEGNRKVTLDHGPIADINWSVEA